MIWALDSVDERAENTISKRLHNTLATIVLGNILELPLSLIVTFKAA